MPLFARLTEICEAPSEAFTDADLDVVCNEIYDIGDQVWASPVQGWTDILERALVTHYWFRDEESKSPDIVAARGLVSGAYQTGATKRRGRPSVMCCGCRVPARACDSRLASAVLARGQSRGEH